MKNFSSFYSIDNFLTNTERLKMKAPIKIGIACHKGGVGKTATVAALADAVTYENPTSRVLLLDGDEQNCLKTIFGVKMHETQGGLASILLGQTSLDQVKVKVRPNIDLVLSGGRQMKEFERLFASQERAELIMREKLGNLSEYDFVFIDCPPAISLISANVVTFSDYILIPCIPDLLAFVGAKQTINFIESVGKFYIDADFPLAQILGVVLTQFDQRQSLDNTIESDLENLQNSGLVRRCFKSIPKDIKVKTAQVRRKLLSEGFASSNAAKAYRELIQDIISEIQLIETEATEKAAIFRRNSPTVSATL